MSTLAQRVAALESEDLKPLLMVALVQVAVVAISTEIPAPTDAKAFKDANAAHQLGQSILASPALYVDQLWRAIVCSDHPLATATDPADEAITGAVTALWPALAGTSS